MPIVFMDESGYTGPNLLSLDQPVPQPVFTLATLCATEEECKQIKTNFFPGFELVELSHSRMMKGSRRVRHQSMIIEFMHLLAQNPELAKLEVVNKRYALLYKLVDFIIVPAAAKDGFDFYVKGRNIGLINSFYYGLSELGGEDFCENFLRRFQNMMRSLDETSYHSFFNPIINERYRQPLENFLENPLDYLLWHIQKSYDSLGYDLINQLKAAFDQVQLARIEPLEIALASTLRLMGKWRKDLPGDITLIHHRSSKMSASLRLWNTLVDPNLPIAMVGYDSSALAFPIGVKETLLEDAKNWIGLQLADILAGATTYWAQWCLEGKNSNDEYGKTLDTILPPFPITSVWPSRKVTPKELGTANRNVRSNLGYIDKVLAMQRLRDAGASFFYIIDPDQLQS